MSLHNQNFVQKYCILVLYLAYVVNGALYHNPPDFKEPLVLKIVERNQKLQFEKLKSKDASNLVRNLYNQDIKSKVALSRQSAIETYAKDITNIDLISNFLKKNKKGELKNFKKLLVKRIVPHNYKTASLEYDHNYNSYFRPLIRIHKSKNDYTEEPTSSDEEVYVESPNKRNKFEKLQLHHFKDGTLMQPFESEVGDKRDTGNKKEILSVVKNIQDLLGKVKDKKLKIDTYKKMMKVLYNLDGLRTKSGETMSINLDEDIIMPAEAAKLPEDKPAVFDRPYHSFYNYWTHQKQIHQDRCPEELVKIGNVCSWIPPH